ncbi:lipopolysaccharide biosynthesis protein [Streptomyces sp. NPDC086147]|uniref:lipopolysaccharide biosynthesis protein n=1 Tax=Streptomyces sp. NPDC086147 TaxID=3155295 RepID=UPI00344E9D63
MTGAGPPRGAAPDAPGRPGAPGTKGGDGGSRGEDSLFRNAYALMLSTGVSAALGLGFWLIAARHYTEEAVGQGSAAIAAQRMLASVTATTLSGAVVRYVPRAGRATGPLVARLYLLSTVVVAAASGIFLLTLDLWGPSYAPLGTLSAGLFFVLSSVGWALLTLQDGVLTGLRKAFWVPVGNAVFSLGKLVLLVLLAAALPVLGVFVSWAAAIALSTVPLAWLVFRRLIPQQVRADRDRETPAYREIGRFVAGDAAGAFFSLAMISLLPVMVAVRFDAAHNAFFYTAYTVDGTMEFMAINMASPLTAHASHSPESLAEGVRGALRRMVLLLVPVVLVLVLFAPLVLTPFGRGYTDHGSTVLRLLAAGALPRVVVELYIGVLRVQGRTGVLAAVQAGMCVLVLGGAAVLLGPYGISGAGWAVLGGMTVTAAACAPGLRAVLKGREPGAPAAPDDDGYGTDWARRRARSRATAARDAVTPAYGVPVDAVTPAYGTSVDAPRPRAPAPGPFSYGKNPTGSSPSHQTATRARGRTSATARVNSGSMKGLAGAPDVARSSRQAPISRALNSPGLTTRMRTALTLPTPRSLSPPRVLPGQDGTGPQRPETGTPGLSVTDPRRRGHGEVPYSERDFSPTAPKNPWSRRQTRRYR